MEMCIRLMHTKKPRGYHTFAHLLVATELLENSCFHPIFMDCKLHWSGLQVPPLPSLAAAAVISLHMSLVKAMRANYADLNESCEVGAAAVFVDAVREMQGDLQTAIKSLAGDTQLAKQTGLGHSIMKDNPGLELTGEVQTVFSRVPAEHKLLLILIRFWVQLARVAPLTSNQQATLTVPAMQSLGFADISMLLNICGADILARGQPIYVEDFNALASRWKRHVCGNLQGRVLPGCSYWDCTNLGGFSEAALSTCLCGGCKRARYCCKDCQRAAWVEGHREVCVSLQQH